MHSRKNHENEVGQLDDEYQEETGPFLTFWLARAATHTALHDGTKAECGVVIGSIHDTP